MNSRAILPILTGAVVAEGIGVGLFLLIAHVFVTGVRSPWVLVAILALVGGTVGGLSSLIRRRR